MMRKTPKVTPKWPPSVPKVTQSDPKVEPKCPKLPIWSHLGLNFGELGANLGQLRVDLGTTWYQLRQILATVNPKWTQSVPKSPQSASSWHRSSIQDNVLMVEYPKKLNFLGDSTLKTLSRTRAAARTPKGDKSAEPLWFKGVSDWFGREERGTKFFRLGPPLPPT